MNPMIINIFRGIGVDTLEGLKRFNPDGNRGYEVGGLKIDSSNYLLVIESTEDKVETKSLFYEFKNDDSFKDSVADKLKKLEDRGFESVMIALVENDLPKEKGYKFNNLVFLSDYNRDTLKKRKVIREVNKFSQSERKGLTYDKMANTILDSDLLDEDALAFVLDKDTTVSSILSDMYFINKDNKWLQN